MSLAAYGYVYEPFSGTAGEMVLYRFDPSLSSPFNDLIAQPVALDPAKDYTFSLTVIGTELHGQVFEIGGGMVAESFATDATYASGYSGLLCISEDDSVPPAEPTPDFTIDNFQTEDVVAGIPGDYNNNLKVDAADYVLWRNDPDAFGGNPTGYNTWRASFGNPPGSGAGLGGGGAVPEPASATLALLGFAWLRFGRHRADRPR